MHRMTQSISVCSASRLGIAGLQHRIICSFAMLAMLVSTATVHAQGYPPSPVAQANLDFQAGGVVMPAGGAMPMMQGAPYSGSVAPVGFLSGFNPSPCDAGCGGCESCDMSYSDSCGCGDCGSGCGDSCGMGGCGCGSGGNGLLSRLGSGSMIGSCGCPSCGGLSNLRNICFFCRGDGCSACQSFGQGQILGGVGALLNAMRPYSAAGLGAQRWYDISAEALWLGHTSGGPNSVLTTSGISGTPVLTLGQAGSSDLEAGTRLSAAFIFGVGGNVEGTYMGGQEWGGSATATSATPTLYSFVSDFGVTPPGGFDDTDRSISQSVVTSSTFHSGELNYRRRTVGAYNRFQGSWLVGLRYLRYDDSLLYSTLGENDNAVNATLPRFFSMDDQLQNSMLGAQAGFDLWWNVTPGVNFGFGLKGGWLKNQIARRTTMTANSILLGAPGITTASGSDQDGVLMTEMQLKLVYRLSHSWSFRTAYYAIAVDDVGFGTTDGSQIQNFVQGNPVTSPAVTFDSLVVQGGSFGVEYLW